MTRIGLHDSAKADAIGQAGPVWQSAAKQLEDGLSVLGQALDATAQNRLLDYAQQMLRWNRAYNLTAVTEPAEIVSRHLLDSLSILPWIEPGLTVDVGTGAGLPGIPLAIALPRQPFVLLDSNGKRMRFLAHILRTLHLDNAELVTARAEQWRSNQTITQVVSRAFAPLPRQLEWCGGLLGDGARLLAMTGKHDAAQLRNWPAGYTLRHSHRLTVPGNSGERHLLEIVTA